ncbi:hypothetical protein [Lysobacter auxotrophicus]|uniref:Lipoprotein n=1 Tax=Lysobacter auxotrophicus TaxID=2992573 RepID=A0ABM8DBJ6_9GAMM|nr:hypothetical protein [Lysobacter auxotrophicus]BDU15953.1 hypothetical protein LA521A_11540 [Lysobacter auxotrophicus]
MKTITSAMAVAAVAALTFVAACSTSKAMQASVSAARMPAADGVVCPSEDNGMKGPMTVYVDVQYTPDGTPSAAPDVCYIDSGATVVWRDPPERTTAFNLVFTDKSTHREVAKLKASMVAKRYKLSAVITGEPEQQFKYGIQANGRTVDPAIIIKRSQ